MSAVMIEVRGIPAPQGSKDAFVNKRTGRAQVKESSAKVKPWREAVRSEVQRAMEGDDIQPMSGPLDICIAFFLPRPKAHYRTGKHSSELRPDAPRMSSKRPDLDKLIRSTLDGLTSGGIYGDDAQVAAIVASKAYTGGAFIGAVITMGEAL